MKIFKILFFTSIIVLCSSFNNTADKQNKVKISRFLIAKSGYQIVQYDDGNLIKSMTNRYPLKNSLFQVQNKKILTEYNLIDMEQLSKELEALPDLKSDVFPKIYYEFIVDGDTITTKMFIQRSTPNQLKKIDKLLYQYSTEMY